MKMKILASLVFSGLVLSITGCVPTVGGHMKAGVPLLHDKIISRYERTVPQLAAATREVLNRNGKLLVDNIIGNSFEAKINQRDVYVKLDADAKDPKVTQVTVQARTSLGADIGLAAEIDKQIALQLTTASAQ